MQAPALNRKFELSGSEREQIRVTPDIDAALEPDPPADELAEELAAQIPDE